MTNKKAFLLLNGVFPKKLPNLNDYNIICATDGAYQHLKKHNIIPNFIAGDFDSLENIPNNIEAIHTPNQDFTDFDKTLQILFDKDFYNIDVYGASGQEQDHFLGNLDTAIRWKSKLKINFFDDYSRYFLADKYTKITHCKDKIISLIPFPKVSNIQTKGLQYQLNNESLIFGRNGLNEQYDIHFRLINITDYNVSYCPFNYCPDHEQAESWSWQQDEIRCLSLSKGGN